MSETPETITELSENRKYWFVRTSDGSNYDYFFDTGVIGINWDSITYRDIIEKSPEDVKAKIASSYHLDPFLMTDKKAISAIYNKLKRFRGLNQGDIIVMPSKGSETIAFGEVTDNTLIENEDIITYAPYQKLRRVNWLHSQSFDSLDPIFYKIRKSRHSISNVDEYAVYIDRLLNTVYQKGEVVHLVVKVGDNTSDIDAKAMADFISSSTFFLNEINKFLDIEDEVGTVNIKIKAQSKGFLEYLQEKGKGLGLLVFLLFASCNGSQETNNAEVNVIIEQNPEEYKKLMDSAKIINAEIHNFMR